MSQSGAVLDHIGRFRPREISSPETRAIGTGWRPSGFRFQKIVSPRTVSTAPTSGLADAVEVVTLTRVPRGRSGICAAADSVSHIPKDNTETAIIDRHMR